MSIDNCRICGSAFTEKFVFREMMFGFRDLFNYAACGNCGALQTLSIPSNIDKYYPADYVSFTQVTPVLKRQPIQKRLVGNLRIKRKYKVSGNLLINYLRPIETTPSARILDIGCGKGALICALFNLGFENVTGVDKFIPEEVDHGYGVRVLKKELTELPAHSYDLLIMHHVLEHVDDQVAEMKECHRLLKERGVLMISIPLLGKAWEIYGGNWVQLDAPRHYVLHTMKSLSLLAERTGFKIQNVIFDSSAFQFLGSELYEKDIPLVDPETHKWNAFDKHFTPEEIANFEKQAQILNAAQQGDAARFYLYKI
ncbi:class I SAM-dependent methyltransferase [Mucilaginibacter aquaedulcis]|uniref:class I SAM-dependent methyltransferase n=1 Tax=Mucilaginibacter aquaedulcis TaxID=1187081 RepID=UPI0025B62909|nr:class I SAM-dependent methyltransferase [Mucilaginibacter aquaedulcis]MDN3550797.1 class I SAM-dependent methyltransferase [Mucilaginibacter aquaedulcis]